MNISGIKSADLLFAPAWENAARRTERTDKSQQEEAEEAFGKAVRACDRESERMVDRHHESVAKSAKERAIYQRKKAITDRVRTDAQKRDILNETVMIQRLNHRNMLKESLMKDIKQEEINRARQN